MKMKYLFGACMLLGSLASCTSDEIVPTKGGDIDVPGSGAVVFSLEGLGSGSVENPGTRATILATQEENRIDSLDIYVFAYDNDGTFDEDLTVTTPAVIAQLTPDDAAAADETKWYLQEKWTWKSPEPGRSSGVVDTDLPQLHEIAQLGGSGVARTAVIYPERGRFLKFFIVANGGELTNTAAETVYTPVFTDKDAAATGTKASDFLNLRLRLGVKPEDPAQVFSIECPLPMTAKMSTTAAAAVDMTAAADPIQITRGVTLTRAVARFDIVNYAALPSQGDYTLTDVIVSNHYSFTNMQNLVPADAAMKDPVKKNLDGRTWSAYTNMGTNERGMMLQSVFYTSPTLAGTDPMKLGLRGVLGKSTAQPGELLTPLNKDVEVKKNNGAELVLEANYRYLLEIKKLGSDINVIFNVIEWDSKILDADFSNAPAPKLICENATGITWRVADTDMNKHFVEMSNTAVGGRLAFELGTYTEDELADLLTAPANPAKIPFKVEVFSLNDNPAFPDDNTWLATPVITFDPVKRDRFNVVLDIRPEAEVPLNVRPDLMVKVSNKEHAEKQLFFRVTSIWQAPERPQDAVVIVGNYTVATNNNTPATWQAVMDNAPAGWKVPTLAEVSEMAGFDIDASFQTVSSALFFKAFPDRNAQTRSGEGTSYWLANGPNDDNAYVLVVSGDKAQMSTQKKTTDALVRYVKPNTAVVLPPAPIVEANTVYEVNGYYVTAPDANENEEYQWASADNATAMDSDPCAGHGKWRMPTMEDFEKMAGWTATWPWSQAAGGDEKEIVSDKAAWNAAFPNGTYWSSVARTSDSRAWNIYSNGNGTANYLWRNKTGSLNVRCVQEKK